MQCPYDSVHCEGWSWSGEQVVMIIVTWSSKQASEYQNTDVKKQVVMINQVANIWFWGATKYYRIVCISWKHPASEQLLGLYQLFQFCVTLWMVLEGISKRNICCGTGFSLGLFQKALCPLVPLMCPLGLPKNQYCALWLHLKTNIFLTPTWTTWT